jgi:transposase
MMGQQPRTESLFYYFRLEDQIPEDHLLRMIDHYVDFRFVRERLKSFYSSTGRPSIDPEVLLRLLLVGYLYGITSERRLLEEVRMHLAYRWFVRLSLEQEVPDHSTFSKNRHGRFRQSGVFREVFEELVRQCLCPYWFHLQFYNFSTTGAGGHLAQSLTALPIDVITRWHHSKRA